MVVADPLFANKVGLRKRFAATVINDIWPEVLFFSAVATAVAAVTKLTRVNLGVPSGLLTVLGTVLGLVISFRTSSAYERYTEGRKLWTNIMLASRNAAQLLWIHVPVDRPKLNTDNDATARLRAVIEKKSMINLVQAFSVSVKHSLRGEAGIYYEDLYPLISMLPRVQGSLQHVDDTLPLWGQHERLRTLHSSDHSLPTLSANGTMGSVNSQGTRRPGGHRKNTDPEKQLLNLYSDVPLLPARNPPKPTIMDYLPILRLFSPFIAVAKYISRKLGGGKRKDQGILGVEMQSGRTMTGKKISPPAADSFVPLEISLYLSGYTNWLLQNGLVQPAIGSTLVAAFGSLQESVLNLERVRNTPIPFAYQAHLRMSLWIYLVLFPFQIVSGPSGMGWYTIPATAFAAFLLVGFLEIGQEIEDPFNYDENDLDLDAFCYQIQRELHEITAHPAFEPSGYIFSEFNQPFAPADRTTAKDMVDNAAHEYHAGMDPVRRTLLKSWREVETVTRQFKSEKVL